MKKLLIAAVALMLAAPVWATALTDNRDTPERAGDFVSLNVASGVVIYAGSMVAVNSSGYAVPAADVSGYMVVGRAETKSDNSGTSYSSTKVINVKRGVFRWANGTNTFTDADIGDMAYVADDATVWSAACATQTIVAGVIIDVDTSGVWVDTYAIGGQGAASLASLAVSGNASVGGTLAVTGVGTFTAESVHNGGIDADYITTDAGYGIDTKSAGTLMIGAATADKVEIADTAISVECQGPLTAKEDILSNELDSETATTLLIGKATATAVTIADTTIATTIEGPLTCSEWLAVTSNSTFTGAATFTVNPVFSANPGVAPTNSASRGATFSINGTNYVIALYPN